MGRGTTNVSRLGPGLNGYTGNQVRPNLENTTPDSLAHVADETAAIEDGVQVSGVTDV